MATAFVGDVRSGGKAPTGNVAFVAAMYFAGPDVDATMEGLSYDGSFLLPLGYTLADFKTGIRDAVLAKAAELGLTVVATDIDIPSFESPP